MCELCRRELRTKLYYEDEKWWVVDCDTCRIPMIVLKEHRAILSPAQSEELMTLAHDLFGPNWIRWEMRRIKDHFHAHVQRG